MALFLPVFILLLSLLALATGNRFGRGFRSNWVVATGGALLSWLSLLFLRFRLPFSLSFSSWWSGQGLVFSSSWRLDEVSWPLASAMSSLLLSAFLSAVRQAMSASWQTWAPGLALTAAALLSALSSDLLTFAFTWVLLDVLVSAIQIDQFSKAEEKRGSLFQVSVNLVGIFLLLAAWALSTSAPELSKGLVIFSAALRLGIFTASRFAPKSNRLRKDIELLLLLSPLAASLALLAHAEGLSGQTANLILWLAFLPASYAAFKAIFAAPGKRGHLYWVLGQAALAVVAAVSGASMATLVLSLALLFGGAMLSLRPKVGYARVPLIVVGGFALSSLPFTPTYFTSEFFVSPSSVFVYIFLPIQALLLLAWLRQIWLGEEVEEPSEPWAHAILNTSVYMLPILFILLGVGFAPSLSPRNLQLILWPGALNVILTGLFALALRLPAPKLSSRVAGALEAFFSLSWLIRAGEILFRTIQWLLRFVNRLLEGEAGVLWALLLIALLLSLVAQYGLAG